MIVKADIKQGDKPDHVEIAVHRYDNRHCTPRRHAGIHQRTHRLIQLPVEPVVQTRVDVGHPQFQMKMDQQNNGVAGQGDQKCTRDFPPPTQESKDAP